MSYISEKIKKYYLKKYLRIFSFAILSLFISSLCYSQKKGRALIGFEYGLPQHAAPAIHNGYGFIVGYERELSHRFTWVLQSGYLRFDVDGGYNSSFYSFVPIVTGAKCYPVEAFRGFFVENDIGLTSVYIDIPNDPNHTVTKFTFTPALGYHLNGFEISFRANLVQNYPYLGFRLACKF